MKILIVKLSSIGDVIHTLPVLSAIHKALPDAEISWVVEKSAAEILRNNELLTNLIEVDTRSMRADKAIGSIVLEIRRQWNNLRKFEFDVVIDFQGLLKSAFITRFSRAKKRLGFGKESLREPTSRFLLTKTFPVAQNLHIVKKNLELVAEALKIDVPKDNFEFPLYTDEQHRYEAIEIVKQTSGKFVILNPSAGWETKMWSSEKYGQLGDRIWEELGLSSIVTTAPNEKSLAERVMKSSKSGKIILSMPSLKGFYELAKRAELYIGGDTGPTFLAVAAKTPIVGIFGPTEWWRNGSPNNFDICVERTDIDCRQNCHRRTCSNWVCMNIGVETVLEAVKKRLSEVRIG